jgi:hypothetical protein
MNVPPPHTPLVAAAPNDAWTAMALSRVGYSSWKRAEGMDSTVTLRRRCTACGLRRATGTAASATLCASGPVRWMSFNRSCRSVTIPPRRERILRRWHTKSGSWRTSGKGMGLAAERGTSKISSPRYRRLPLNCQSRAHGIRYIRLCPSGKDVLKIMLCHSGLLFGGHRDQLDGQRATNHVSGDEPRYRRPPRVLRR